MPLVKLAYAEAVNNSKEPLSQWPRDTQAQDRRLRPFCRPRIQPTFQIQPQDLIFTIGSCFARNVEQHLIIEGSNVAATRFESLCEVEGVKVKSSTLNKFVAQSILNELRWALDPGAEFPWDSIVEVRDGRFVDMQLAAGLMPASKETMFAIRRSTLAYMKMIKEAKVVILTLGLAEAWYDTDYRLYTNTMPLKGAIEKYPDRFELHILDYNELVSTLREILRLLEAYGDPDFRMLLTVSPVALATTFGGDDAMIANCYSKSVQRAAAEAICRENSHVDYFPSYESVTLSDRSLAWREDQAHVADDVVRLNVLAMQNAYVRAERIGWPQETDEDSRTGALILVKRATTFAASGDLAAANTLFARAAEIAPDEVLVHIRWGLSLFEQKAFAEAAAELSKAMELGGQSYGIAYPLGKCLARTGNYEAAEKALRVAINDLPNKAGPLRLLAKVLQALGRKEEAMRFFEESESFEIRDARTCASVGQSPADCIARNV
jgi:tetratricopeptide (TPR) repeat protein